MNSQHTKKIIKCNKQTKKCKPNSIVECCADFYALHGACVRAAFLIFIHRVMCKWCIHTVLIHSHINSVCWHQKPKKIEKKQWVRWDESNSNLSTIWCSIHTFVRSFPFSLFIFSHSWPFFISILLLHRVFVRIYFYSFCLHTLNIRANVEK